MTQVTLVCRYEGTWGAVKDKADGIMLMYNPDDGAQTNEVNLWYVQPAPPCKTSPRRMCYPPIMVVLCVQAAVVCGLPL